MNVGVLAIALAWPVALYGAGWKADALMQTFPCSLFLTLLGVSLLSAWRRRTGRWTLSLPGRYACAVVAPRAAADALSARLRLRRWGRVRSRPPR